MKIKRGFIERFVIFMASFIVGMLSTYVIVGIWQFDRGYLDWRGLIMFLACIFMVGTLLVRRHEDPPDYTYSEEEYKEFLSTIDNLSREESEMLEEVYRGIPKKERGRLQSGSFESGEQV